MPCIIDGNKEITTPIETILKMLRDQTITMGSPKLSSIEVRGSEARITCPSHKGGQESSPSCYVLLKDSGKYPAGTTHCFACGFRANIVKLVSTCLGCSYKDATTWLLNVSNYELQEDKRDIEIISLDDNVNSEIDGCSRENVVSLEELKKYDNVHPYMYKRKLTDEVICKFDVGYDPDTDCITFPVYVNGECKFVLKRKVKYKMFIMPEMKHKPIYGLDYVTGDEVIVCESVINALTCWSYGKQAIALLGTGSSEQIEELRHIPQRKIILALDGDEAGRKGEKRIKDAMVGYKIVSKYLIPNGRDVNDLSKEEFDNLKEISIF